jgi:hypothetical protein
MRAVCALTHSCVCNRRANISAVEMDNRDGRGGDERGESRRSWWRPWESTQDGVGGVNVGASTSRDVGMNYAASASHGITSGARGTAAIGVRDAEQSRKVSFLMFI